MEDTIEVGKTLLALGADPAIEDKRGETPIVASTKTYELAVIACYLDSLDRQERENEQVEFGVRDLLEMTTAETGETLLHHAAAFMDADSIRTLVKKGADLVVVIVIAAAAVVAVVSAATDLIVVAVAAVAADVFCCCCCFYCR